MPICGRRRQAADLTLRTTVFLFGLVACHAAASATEVGFRFSGFLAQPARAFEQGPFAPGVPVNGRFVYQTESVSSHELADGDAQGYRQQIFNGFCLTVGGITFRADDYIIAIFNDDSKNQMADVVTILYSNRLAPPPDKPILVGKTPFSSGMLNVTLKNPAGTAFSDSKLPSQLPTSAFGSQPNYAFYSDTATDYSDDAVILISEFSQLAAVSGDYDFDADVDGADFLIWQRSFESTVELAADGTHNNLIDLGDLAIWRNHFGEGIQSVRAIPEPATIALLCIFGLALSIRSPVANG